MAVSREAVEAALGKIVDPGQGKDLISAEATPGSRNPRDPDTAPRAVVG